MLLQSPKTAIEPPTFQGSRVKNIEAECQNGTVPYLTVRYGIVRYGTVICSASPSSQVIIFFFFVVALMVLINESGVYGCLSLLPLNALKIIWKVDATAKAINGSLLSLKLLDLRQVDDV